MGKYASQQPRETPIEFLRAQGIHVRRAHISRLHKTCIAQDPEVMGHAGLGATTVELAARGLGHAREIADNVHAHGVAQGVQQPLKDKIGRQGVFESSHGRMITKGFNCRHISNTIEQAN